MRRVVLAALALAAAFPMQELAAQTAPPPKAADAASDPETANVLRARDLVEAHRPEEAIPILDQVIANEAKAHADEKRTIYCARSLPEVLMYMGMAANAKTSAVALGPTWATAFFLKGFALVDAGRADDAKPLYDKAVSLSPMNAQFLSELGEWYRTHGDAAAAYAQFQKASEAATFSPDATRSFEKRRALRGTAFILTDEGKLDEAEALYQQCLKLDPTDAHAKSELEYIREQRAKQKSAV
jgi:tetratricopeptide (TPR) repeat protein